MNPAVFLSLPDLRCSLLLLVSVCRDDKPSDCVPDRLPPSARGNGAAPASLDPPPLVRRAPPGAAFTLARSLDFLGPRSTRPAEPLSGIGTSKWENSPYVGGHSRAPLEYVSVLWTARTCLGHQNPKGPRGHLMFFPTLGRV